MAEDRKKYLVRVDLPSFFEREIEADSLEDARSIAQERLKDKLSDGDLRDFIMDRTTFTAAEEDV